MDVIRQGDVWIYLNTTDKSKLRASIQQKRKNVRRRKNIGLVLAEGEVTGHHHRIETKGVRMTQEGDTLYLHVPESGATLVHEEHEPLDLPGGFHQVKIQREYVAPKPEPKAPARERYVYD